MTQSAALASPALGKDEQIEIAAASDLEGLTMRLAKARGVEEILRVVRGGARRLVGADGISFVLREGDKCFYADEDAIGRGHDRFLSLARFRSWDGQSRNRTAG